MSPKTRTPKRKSTAAGGKKLKSFTDDERAAMKERIRELKTNTDGEGALLAKISEMKEPERSMARRIHAVVTAAAPELSSRTWYGMPAYSKDDKVVCFFKPGSKFKMRYSEFGFSDTAKLDEGTMWPSAFAVKELNAAAETRIASLVKKAVG
jgi:uncharacterized protein YdhG (YjbR/CyaY superfamily)